MSVKTTRVATFRGRLIEWGVGETKNSGLPQFVCKIACDEIYDEDDKAFVDMAEHIEEGAEEYATGYLVLFGKNTKATFHCAALKEALGWDGKSFSALATADYSEAVVQFRTEENNYDKKTTIQLVAIAADDADPSRGLRTLDAKGLKNLDAKFGGGLRGVGGTAAASKKAPKRKPATVPPSEDDVPF